MEKFMEIEIEEVSPLKMTSKYPIHPIVDPEYSSFSLSASDVM
jgi:hypothetical protein